MIDGRFVGLAPLRVTDVAPGSRTVTVELAGQPTFSQQIDVRAGQVAQVRANLAGGGAPVGSR